MEIAIIFAIGWVASHAFSEKRDEYSASQEAHRENYLAKLDKQHPSWGRARREQYLRNAARRNALGHFAYLLRHGWSSTFNDFHHGWKQAKTAHGEWKAERPDNEKFGFWKTFKTGWKNQVARRPQPEKPEPASVTPPAPAPEPETGQTWREKHDLENKYQRFAELRRRSGSPLTAAQLVNEVEVNPGSAEELAQQWNDRFQRENPGTESTAKVFPISGKTTKASGNTAGSTNRSTTVEFNYDRTRTEMNGIGEFASRTLSVLEQILADAIAGEMNQDTETMAHLASLHEALSNTQAHAAAVADSMGKHTSGQEYANTGHAASTGYLKSN